MGDHRDHKGSKADFELVAFKELRDRVTRLRRRVFLPTAAAALVAGHAGLAAHALGYWSILGYTSSGQYRVSAMTLVIALIFPAIPFAAGGVLAYRVLAARLRAAWCDDFAGKHGLTRVALERNAARYG